MDKNTIDAIKRMLRRMGYKFEWANTYDKPSYVFKKQYNALNHGILRLIEMEETKCE